MEKKREGDREAAGEVFLSFDPLYHCFFGIGDEKGELLKLLLDPCLQIELLHRRIDSRCHQIEVCGH
jgi:hypothetical protein